MSFRLKWLLLYQAELRVNSTFIFTLFRMFNANEMQDFTCELPSTGRHIAMCGEEGPGP